MATIQALKITHALPSSGPSNAPVYPQINLLPNWARLFDLWLEVPRPWPGSAVGGQTDVVQLWFKPPGGIWQVVGQWQFPGLITFPLKLTMPQQYLTVGVSEVRITVITDDGTQHESEPTIITIEDRVPLDGATPDEPIVPEETTIGAGVTTEYLNKHCNVVQIGIPGHSGYIHGDTVRIFFGPPNAPVVMEVLINHLEGETIVPLPGWIFVNIGNGVYLLHYRIVSRAGVSSQESMAKFIRVDIN
ncbi:hypothetical protein [Pseudomonas sp. COW5]|uniref:hypothetical protein n=1 Tax=Pseudomonas sp. COW5 TaxID=2981253 RepID=UPI002246EBCF|nr:hypothetical protein [Pseudomonas sp. COW5]MCX2546172.1 hypothetical protein [Pseudomonas sp. COW5]